MDLPAPVFFEEIPVNQRSAGIQSDDLEVFLSLVENFSQWTCDGQILNQRVEEVSGWSVGEHLDHVLMADLLNMKAVRMLEMRRGKETSDGLNEAGTVVFSSGEIPLGKATAPDFVIPQPGRSAEQIEELRLEVLDGWKQVAPRLDEIDSTGRVLSHHAVGDLGAWQWLRFARIHTQHHQMIAGRIIEASEETA